MQVRPSGAHQWQHCAGAPVMQSHYPDDDSDAAREGVAAHEVAAQMLMPYTKPNMPLKMKSEFVGTLASNGVLIDEQMAQGAVDYVTDVLSYCNKTGLAQSLHIEETIDVSIVIPHEKGTPDLWVWDPTTLTLTVWDYKYGFGVVDVFENPQLIIYVWSIMQLLLIDGITDQMITVRMVLFQPRSFQHDGPMHEWITTGSDLRGYVNKLKSAAASALSPDPTCIPGNHCRYCTARSACGALQQSAYMSIDYERAANPLELHGADLALEYSILDHALTLIKYRKEAMESQIIAEFRNGNLVPGYVVKPKYGRTRWKKSTPVDQVIMMGDLCGVDLRKPLELITPAQSVNKGIDDTAISCYTEKPSAGFKLEKDDLNLARQAFGKNKIIEEINND